MRSAVVVDTHTIIWYLSGDRRLSNRSLQTLESAESFGMTICVPAICLVELIYLVEKGRLPSIARDRLLGALDDSMSNCELTPLDRRIADALEFVSRDEVPDMPDRIIAATGVALGAPVISRDGKIRSSSVETIW